MRHAMHNHRLLLLLLAGCGGSHTSPDVRASAQQSFDAGRAAFESRDYETAAAQCEVALSGGLPADLLGEAAVMRSVSLGHLGRPDKGIQLIDSYEQGLGGEDELRLTKARIYIAAGMEQQAQAEMKPARQAR